MSTICPVCGATAEVKEFSGIGVAVAPTTDMSEAVTALVDGVIESTGYGR